MARVNFPNSCLTLPLNTIPDIKGRPIQELMVYVKNIDGYSIEIHFVGDSLDTGRNIKEHSLYSSGDVIKLTERKKSYYMVDITQKVFVEEDPNNNCRDYPNQDFRSYRDCEDRYIRNLLPGLTPLWLSDNFAEVSTQVFDENDRYFSPLGDFADGTRITDCPLPCKTTQTRSKVLYDSLGEGTSFDIQFSSTVRVSKTDLVKSTVSSFLSEVGVNLIDFQKMIIC